MFTKEEYQKVLDRLGEKDGMKLRFAERFSFGSSEKCMELFDYSMRCYDSSINEVRYLPQYTDVIEWMTDTRGKGLLLAGSCGTGKTCVMAGVIRPLFNIVHHRNIYIMSAQELSRMKETNLNQYIRESWAYMIDDVGAEFQRNDYGSKRIPLNEILDDAERNFKPVFITTNLSYNEIQERYGDRAADRIAGLCKCVRFDGQSFRHDRELAQ